MSDWYSMDAGYRYMCASGICGRAPSSAIRSRSLPRAVADWAENLYSNWFLADANACWTSACAGVGRLRLHRGSRTAGMVPTRYVRCPSLGVSAKRRSLSSDALRYGWVPDVAAASASAAATSRFLACRRSFPSTTEVGMPALLPHQALGLAAMVRSRLADGKPTATTPQREAVLTPC